MRVVEESNILKTETKAKSLINVIGTSLEWIMRGSDYTRVTVYNILLATAKGDGTSGGKKGRKTH